MTETNGTNGNMRWQTFASLAVIGLTIGGALITFYIQSMNMSTQVAALQVAMKAVEDNVARMSDRLAEERSSSIQLQTSLTEIETQFCSSDIIRNLMQANDMRMMAMVWKKLYNQTIPTDNAYYPQVCNRATSTSTNSNSGR
jgi:uncharacterized protein (DUF1786 family)